MRRLLCLALLLAQPAWAETVEPEVPARPGDPHGSAPLWDGVAECAAILAVASARATSRIDRDQLEVAAGTWFAATFTLAAADGAEITPEELGTYVADWGGSIGSLGALDRMTDWMAYCDHIGRTNALDARVFTKRAPVQEDPVDEDIASN